jgi:hypothetical protein
MSVKSDDEITPYPIEQASAFNFQDKELDEDEKLK